MMHTKTEHLREKYTKNKIGSCLGIIAPLFRGVSFEIFDHHIEDTLQQCFLCWDFNMLDTRNLSDNNEFVIEEFCHITP
eukprot:m.204442 g.204442  ORF g.204442 m.204442 type:complete len:79 (+) comp32888_c1_seq2:575-811(+)